MPLPKKALPTDSVLPPQTQVIDLMQALRTSLVQQPVEPAMVEVPDTVTVAELSLDDATKQSLDALCTSYRSMQDKAKKLEEDKKKLKEGMDPILSQIQARRIIGETWDIRKQERTNEKINADLLKNLLLRLDIKMAVDCPKCLGFGTVELVDQTVVICGGCQGKRQIVLEGVDAVRAAIEQVTDVSTSVSWTVYGIKTKKAEE